jgi:hypothetical protein
MVSVYYRPTHEYLFSVEWDELGKRRVMDYILMSRENFYKFLREENIKVPLKSSTLIESPLFCDREDWFLGAWEGHTKKVMLELGIDFDKLFETILM